MDSPSIGSFGRPCAIRDVSPPSFHTIIAEWACGHVAVAGTGLPACDDRGRGLPLKRIVVGISGASGSVYALRLLQRLAEAKDVETHLVATRPGEMTLHQETGERIAGLRELVQQVHPVERIGATIASGSFLFDAMAIVPCSMHTMASIACGLASNLITRAADVALKEKRRLILVVRESPLHLGHLRNMVTLAEMGAIIAPPMPAFYMLPKTVDDIVDQHVVRLLDLLGVGDVEANRWSGL